MPTVAISTLLKNSLSGSFVDNNGATTSGTITPTGYSTQYEILGLIGTIIVAIPSL